MGYIARQAHVFLRPRQSDIPVGVHSKERVFGSSGEMTRQPAVADSATTRASRTERQMRGYNVRNTSGALLLVFSKH
jgi:hypothetical protein